MVNVVMESFDGHEACSTLPGPPDTEKLGDNVSACLFVHVLSAAFNENHTLDKLYTEVSLAHEFWIQISEATSNKGVLLGHSLAKG